MSDSGSDDVAQRISTLSCARLQPGIPLSIIGAAFSWAISPCVNRQRWGLLSSPCKGGTAQPRVAAAHPGDPAPCPRSTLQGWHNAPADACPTLSGWKQENDGYFPRVRCRDPGLCCTTLLG